MIGGGAGAAPSTTTTGTGVVTALGVNVGSVGAFVTNGGALGTPSSGTLTNATGLPISTGVSGLGTGVATALGVNVGSAGAPVVNGGALGTPASGTATNLTGLPISTGVSGLGTGNATALAVNVGSAGAFVRNNAAETISGALTLTSAAPQITAGVNATTLGSIKMFGNTSGDLTIQPTAAAGTASVATFPARSGTVAYTSGALTSGNCAKFDASGNIVDNGAVCGGGGGTPGGANTQVQFNNSGAFGGDAGFTWDNTNKVISALGGGTVTASAPVINASQTWNNVAVSFVGLKFNATSTASASTSLLMDLQTGGVDAFTVQKDGTAKEWKNSTDYTAQYPAARIVSYMNSLGETTSLIFDDGSGNGNGSGLLMGANSSLRWNSTDRTDSGSNDLFLTRAAAASLRHGAADAASPVAQTVGVQNVVAGTTNTAGAKWTFKDSAGTGTGVSGGYEFQTADAGSSGTSQNTEASAFTIGVIGAGVIQIKKVYTVATLPTCNAGASGSLAVVSDATTPTYNAALTGGGAVKVPVFCDGSAWTSH